MASAHCPSCHEKKNFKGSIPTACPDCGTVLQAEGIEVVVGRCSICRVPHTQERLFAINGVNYCMNDKPPPQR
jgi:hypothetical protein